MESGREGEMGGKKKEESERASSCTVRPLLSKHGLNMLEVSIVFIVEGIEDCLIINLW